MMAMQAFSKFEQLAIYRVYFIVLRQRRGRVYLSPTIATAIPKPVRIWPNSLSFVFLQLNRRRQKNTSRFARKERHLLPICHDWSFVEATIRLRKSIALGGHKYFLLLPIRTNQNTPLWIRLWESRLRISTVKMLFIVIGWLFNFQALLTTPLDVPSFEFWWFWISLFWILIAH